MKKPPFTEAEKACLDSDIDRWKRTGYGINPDQSALRHYPDDETCPCHFCTGAPIYHSYQSRRSYGSVEGLLPPTQRPFWLRGDVDL